jgi:hypothetical protein
MLLLTAGIALGACSKSHSSGTEDSCNGVPIQRFKELTVVDPAVISDARSLNGPNGVWSFRHALEGIVPEAVDTSAFIRAWLDDWVTTTEVNGFKTDRESRAAGMKTILMCPWLLSTPENQCDNICETCPGGQKLDLAKAPFRLVAIVNRTDLRTRPDSASPAGESRLVFALTNGPADDPSSKPLAMSLIFEFALPDSLTPKGWAEQWHALATHAAFDDAYKADLEALTERFVKRGASPSRTNGSAISQVRTNESTFDWIWQLREFHLDSLGGLHLAPTANTPGETLNGSPILSDFIKSKADDIHADRMVLPPSFTAGAADQFLYRWSFSGVDEPTRAAFARQTCNGCHSGENPPIDTAFHVSPFRVGPDKLSPFLNNPSDPTHDELGRREKLMSQILCED